MAHARADTSPVREGISGALEVFFDTAILCSLTALALLVSDVPPQGNGMAYVLSVFSYELGFRVIGVLLFLIACFAFATILCWYFYGSECFRILFPGRQALFFPLFLLAVFAGPFCPPALLLSAMDAFLVLMSCLTLPVLLRNTDRLVALSRAEGLLRPKEKPPRVPPLSESPQ